MQKRMLWLLYVWLYAGWFLCVLAGRENLGIYALLVPVVGWLILSRAFSLARMDYLKILALSGVGILVDSAALSFGLIGFGAGQQPALFLPLWLVALWLLFAPSAFVLSRLLKGRYALAALLGAVVGALSYKSGESFGVLFFLKPYSLLIYAFFWSFYLPLSIRWLNGARALKQP